MPEPIHQRIEKIRLWAKDPDRTASHILITILAVVVVVTLALWIVWIVPQHEVARSMDAALQHDRAKQLELENEFRKTLTQIVLSIFGLFILYFTWQRARTGDKTVQIMEQGHITDRYTKAIEQLGKLDGDKPNIEIRLGAIYALERIAHDSPRDHWTIMEVLTAYVRQNAPAAPKGEPPEKPTPEKPRTDIQAILTVLGRRLVGPKRERPGQKLDLSSTHLQGAVLAGANLEHALLTKANLQDASLPSVNLQDTVLRETNLQGANLIAANLQRADLREANLQRANLREANLERADLNKANLQRANLNKANLQRANLTEARLQNADPIAADLQRANLTRANLQGAVLWKANLQGAALMEAKLQGANLMEANLQDAILLKAKLQDAHGLTPDQIRSAKSWKSATFSDDLREALGLPPNDPAIANPE